MSAKRQRTLNLSSASSIKERSGNEEEEVNKNSSVLPFPVTCVSIDEEGSETSAFVVHGMTREQLEIFITLIEICDREEIAAWHLVHAFIHDYMDYETKEDWSETWIRKKNIRTFLKEITKDQLLLFFKIRGDEKNMVSWHELDTVLDGPTFIRLLPSYI